MKSKGCFLRSLAKASWDYLRRKVTCSQLPCRLWLEPTNICNIRCEMCPNPLIPREQLGKMDFSLFRQIIDEVGSFVNEIYIFHRGESLIHPELAQMIKYTKDRELLVKLNTNATLLTEKKSRELLESGLDLISFSIDGYEKEVFERIRVGAHFDKVVNNVRSFLKLKKTGDFRRPLTQVEIMEFAAYSDSNLEERRTNFFKNFNGLPFDRIVFRSPHNVGGSIELTKEQGYRLQKRHYFPCSFPWYSLTIHWNGNVYPCPRDFMGDLPLGNLYNTTLSEIWNSKMMLNVRKSILKRSFDDKVCCAHCDQVYRYQSAFAEIPLGYLSALFKDSPLVYALKRFF